jgi:hypothetical protein
MHHARALVLFCILGAVAPGAAHAAPPPGKPVQQAMTEKARQLFAEGVKAYQQSRWADAHAAFLAAWSLSKHYSIAGNLADCELKLGLHKEAAQHFALYVREMAKDGASTPQERKDGEARYAQARAKIARADVQVSVPGAEIYVDGKLAGSAPLEDPLFLDPGSHVLEARGDGYVAARATIAATAGTAQSVVLTLSRPPEPPPVVVPERRSVVPGAVLGGAAGVALATGIGLLVAGSSKRATADEQAKALLGAHHSCVPGAANFDGRCAGIESATSTSDRLHNAGVGVLIGGVALGAAAVTYFAWPSRRISVTPQVGASAGGVWVSGSF